jgi:hypothetical protein
METNARGHHPLFVESSIESWKLAPTPALRPGDAEEIRRSESNILQWMKYLPKGCIDRMIEMGWDVTT